MTIAVAAAAALGAAFTKAAKEAVKFAADLQSVSARLQAATGVSTQEMKKYEEVLKDIYAGNYGDSLESVASAMQKVKRGTERYLCRKLRRQLGKRSVCYAKSKAVHRRVGF